MTIKVQVPLEADLREIADSIQHQMESRAVRASYELYNSSQLVLRGQLSGRRYKVPGTYKRQRDPVDGKMKNGRYYTASAPGEPPAVRLGHFRESWQPYARRVYGVYFSRIESDLRVDDGKYNLGQLLENGTRRMAPRPFEERIIKHAENRINRIYSEPYNI